MQINSTLPDHDPPVKIEHSRVNSFEKDWKINTNKFKTVHLGRVKPNDIVMSDTAPEEL